MQALILKNFRQTGNLKNSAIRAGMSERSFFRWMARCQNARSGPLWHFQQEVERLRADRVALLAVRHYQGAFGCITEVPQYDQFNNLVCDQNGRPVTVRKFLPPNLRAIWRELALHDPETYGPREKTTVPELPPPRQWARPRDLLPMVLSVAKKMKQQGIEIDVYDILGIPRPIETTATSADTAVSAEPAPSAEPGTEGDAA
jgi:hypothetical protein